jgi:hypothetical protein
MNAFLDLAEKQISAPRKARMRAAAKRALEKALRERDRMFSQWKKWHHEQTELLVAGPHGEAVHALAAFLERMTLEQGSELIELVAAGPWRSADRDAKYQVLRLIDWTIAHLRECSGLPPFNDSLPFSDEPPTAFEIIRAAVLA